MRALVAQGLPTVRHALAGVIIQPPGDVLRHVLAVELIHIHHVPQCETPGGCIVKIFFGIKDLDSAIHQASMPQPPEICLFQHPASFAGSWAAYRSCR